MTAGPTFFRYELRSSSQLEQLASLPLPLGTSSGAPVRTFHRDVYLDTADEALRRRGVVCRLRFSAGDVRTLSLWFDKDAAGRRIDSQVAAGGLAEILTEDTEAVRRLAGLLDPVTLRPTLEFEVERITRSADFDWLRRPRAELHYDEITARGNGLSQSFTQLCVHARSRDNGVASRLARALEQQHGLRPLNLGALERAELLLRWNRLHVPPRNGADSDSAYQSPRNAGGAEAEADFLNPELSLLAFQLRVLALAEDSATPIRERLRFLSIVSANLDEFYMVRMAGLQAAAREQRDEAWDDGLTHGAQLEKILEQVTRIIDRQQRCWDSCRRELEGLDVRVSAWSDLSPAQKESLRAQCKEEIQPSLTPLAMTLSPGHPLPHLPHLTLAMAVVTRPRARGRLHLAEIELPPGTRRFLRVPGSEYHVIPVEEVLRANLDLVYPDTRVEGAHLFRVTRGGDLSLDEDAADDLLDAVADAAARRPRNPAVRLEVERDTPAFVRELLLENLRRELGDEEVELQSSDVQEVHGLLDLRSLDELRLPARPDLSFPPTSGADPVPSGVRLIDVIRERDLLVHHPFDSFASTVVRFIQEAAVDPAVTGIKIALYRVGKSSPVVESLLEAARRGKQVAAFVELKARFDEAHNVDWARRLEAAGGKVVYGLVGLKNHAKVCLIVRREGDRLVRYVHAGTGNYNAQSGLQYTDLSLFSSRADLGEDVADLFNALTGESYPPRRLSRGCLVSPHQLVDSLLNRIDHEAALARRGAPARITAKVNGLSDPQVVRALYQAAADGVEIDLVVRGICTLRPALPGRSDRIRVTSVVGRYLEHSRIYRFGNDGVPLYYIGSPDLRPRNLHRRVELLVPVVDTEQQSYLDYCLQLYTDDPGAWNLDAAGEYTRRGTVPGAQELLMRESDARWEQLRNHFATH